MIEIAALSEEDIDQLKKYFLENKIIKLKDIIQPIEEYFWKFDFNSEKQSYELYLGVPNDWVHDMTIEGYGIELFKESENGKIIKLISTDDDVSADLDDLVLFAIDISQRNSAILAKIREKETELKLMKDRMVEKQMELDREIEILKTIKNGEPQEVSKEEDTSEISEEQPPVSKEETDKFVELITNGKS